MFRWCNYGFILYNILVTMIIILLLLMEVMMYTDDVIVYYFTLEWFLCVEPVALSWPLPPRPTRSLPSLQTIIALLLLSTVYVEIFAWRKFLTLFFCPLFSWVKFLSHNFFVPYDYIEPMEIFTAWAKIYSTKYLYSTKVICYNIMTNRK